MIDDIATKMEVTILLLVITSWKRDEENRSWKGYSFDILDLLEEEGLIKQRHGEKSVIVTEKGMEKAKNYLMAYEVGKHILSNPAAFDIPVNTSMSLEDIYKVCSGFNPKGEISCLRKSIQE